MKQKITTFLIALAALAISASASAQEKAFGLYIAGVQVTTTNASGITGDGISGSISYNWNTNTLTLNNATIDATNANSSGIVSDIDSLNILLLGSNIVTGPLEDSPAIFLQKETTIQGDALAELTAMSSSNYGIYCFGSSLTITGGCTVEASGKYGVSGDYGNEVKLTVHNSTLKAMGTLGSIVSIKSLEMTDCTITAPAGAEFDPSLKGVALYGSLVKNEWVEIKPNNDQLSIGSVEVTPTNAADVFNDGTVSYNAQSKTLTLKNASIADKEILSYISGLTIQLIGSNNVKLFGCYAPR